MKILLTTTSFQDTPGKHHDLLESTGFQIDKLRGPVNEDVLLPIIADYDGVVCGDDDYTEKVIAKGKAGKLKVLSKYGVGLDRIDQEAAKKHGVIVCNTPAINQTTVAEHTLALLLTFLKNIHLEYNITKVGGWHRHVGSELMEKKLGIIGLGKVGKELAKRLTVFGVETFAFDKYYDNDFNKEFGVTACDSVEQLVATVDIMSINAPLTEETKSLINADIINSHMKENMIIVNTSRALIIDHEALIDGLKSKKIKGYMTDVMEEEPMVENHPLLQFDNVLITPHIGSRTFENVQKQGSKSVENLIDVLSNN